MIPEKTISRLFDDNRLLICSRLTTDSPSGPNIFKSKVKVKNVILSMKKNKAPGPDNMYSKTFHTLNENSLAIVVKLFNEIYDTGVTPKD